VTAIEEHRPRRRGAVDAPVYVYGIVRAHAAAPRTRGVLGFPVTVVTHGAVGALVSSVREERVRAKRRDLLAHSDVLQAAYERAVVLPLRFGTLFPSEAELCDAFLEPRHDELLSLLERFDGLAEMRLRADYHDQDSVLGAIAADDPRIVRLSDATRNGGASRGELLQLGELVAKRLEARRVSDAHELVARLAAAAAEVRVDEPEDELAVVRASFLVRDRDRARFDDLLEAAALRLRHLVHVRCTGPLPPHSFVGLTGPAGS
jgi:Gas vesicle synthesis protein GvpL/GvpF